MQIKILGCSGGIGGDLRTTSMIIDDDILIDAGTGVIDLEVNELIKINHVFVTHSHLDHIICIPFIVDTLLGFKASPITVYSTKATIDILKEHIFNWRVWPDFNTIPDADNPFLLYREIEVGETVTIDGRMITPLPVNHVVPAVGYHVDSGQNSLIFSGDTTTCDALWEAVNKIDNLKYVIIETAFGNAEIELAKKSKHLCSSMLVEELGKLKHPAEVYITHLKPGEGHLIMKEIFESSLTVKPTALTNGKLFNL